VYRRTTTGVQKIRQKISRQVFILAVWKISNVYLFVKKVLHVSRLWRNSG